MWVLASRKRAVAMESYEDEIWLRLEQEGIRRVKQTPHSTQSGTQLRLDQSLRETAQGMIRRQHSTNSWSRDLPSVLKRFAPPKKLKETNSIRSTPGTISAKGGAGTVKGVRTFLMEREIRPRPEHTRKPFYESQGRKHGKPKTTGSFDSDTEEDRDDSTGDVSLEEVLHAFSHIDLQGSEVSKLDSFVQRFQRLSELNISRCCLRELDLRVLPASLKVLHAYGNRITNVVAFDPISNSSRPQLSHLGLGYNRIASASFLSGALDSLVSLDLSWNALSDVLELADALSAVPNVRLLSLKGNPCSLSVAYSSLLRDLSLPLIQFDGVEADLTGTPPQEVHAAVAKSEEDAAAPPTVVDPRSVQLTVAIDRLVAPPLTDAEVEALQDGLAASKRKPAAAPKGKGKGKTVEAATTETTPSQFVYQIKMFLPDGHVVETSRVKAELVDLGAGDAVAVRSKRASLKVKADKGKGKGNKTESELKPVLAFNHTQTLSFLPSSEWIARLAISGVDLCLYRVEVKPSDTPQAEVQDAPEAKSSALTTAAANETESSEIRTLIGVAHLDTSSMVEGQKTLSQTLAVDTTLSEWRRPGIAHTSRAQKPQDGSSQTIASEKKLQKMVSIDAPRHAHVPHAHVSTQVQSNVPWIWNPEHEVRTQADLDMAASLRLQLGLSDDIGGALSVRLALNDSANEHKQHGAS